MKEFVSTVSSKGQVTIPADVRRRLGVSSADKVAFVLTDEGKVELRPARYSLESVLGSLDALPNETPDLDAEIEIAAEEAAAQRMRRLDRQG
jgi:AbrB family looped-hinge helix DNA binding protein